MVHLIFDRVGWAPSFLLKRYVLTGIRDGPHEPFIADSVDFVVAQVRFIYKNYVYSFVFLFESTTVIAERPSLSVVSIIYSCCWVSSCLGLS